MQDEFMPRSPLGLAYKYNMTFSYQELITELRKVRTVDLASKAASILEKILWIVIGITGTIWASYFITWQVEINSYNT